MIKQIDILLLNEESYHWFDQNSTTLRWEKVLVFLQETSIIDQKCFISLLLSNMVAVKEVEPANTIFAP